MAAVRVILALLLYVLLTSIVAVAEVPDAAELETVEEILHDTGVNLDVGALVKSLVSGGSVSWDELLDAAKAGLISELNGAVALMYKLLLPALLLALAQQFLVEAKKKAAAVELVCFLAAAMALMSAFEASIDTSMALIRTTADFIQVLMPVLTGVLVACGASFTAAAYAPLVTLGSGVITGIISTLAVYMCSSAAYIAVFGSLSSKFSLGKLLGLGKAVLSWIIGITLTSFMGLVAIQNLLSGSHDSAAIRASRYAAKNIIPGIGGEVADTLNAVGGSAVVIKNAVGISGLVALAYICVLPVIKLIAVMLITRLAASVTEPLGVAPLQTLYDRFGDVFSMLIMTACAAVVVTVILIGTVLCAVNTALIY